jgi:aquaporin Z
MKDIDLRKLVAEGAGTALLVFFAVGVATLSFGFGLTGSSISAGVIATSLAFGLVLLVLAYAVGPVSGCHINPAVTLGFLVARRMELREAVGYWVAQVVGAVVGAFALWAVLHGASSYDSDVGLGTNGFGKHSIVGLNAVGAVTTEVILTFLFVFTVLSATRKGAPAIVAGTTIGLSLMVVHLIGIPLTGTSVNPARSLGPALFVGGAALTQLWVFIVAPLAGGALAALAHEYAYPRTEVPEEIALPDVPAQTQRKPAAKRTTASG